MSAQSKMLSSFAIQLAQSAWTVKYTDCTSAKELEPPPQNELPVYDTKSSDHNVPSMVPPNKQEATQGQF